MNANARQYDVGGIYFLVTYLDAKLKIPEIVTMIYLGENLLDDGGETPAQYFQEASSYSAGQSLDSVDKSTLMCASGDALSSFLDWDELIDELARNRSAQKGGPAFYSK